MADNDILEEQRKARQNYLELKKMQHGEMKPEPKPSEMAIEPKTFKEKLQNFWFHYKWHSIAIIFSAIVITVLCVQCANREKYDFEAIYFAYNISMDTQLDSVEKYLEEYATDVDGDGEVNVNIINCSFAENGDMQYRNNMLSKIQTQLVGNREVVMYIMDDKAYEFLNNVVDGGVFTDNILILDEEFYNKTETKELGKLPEGIKVYLRKVKGTVLEDDKKVDAVYKEAEKIIEKIKEVQ